MTRECHTKIEPIQVCTELCSTRDLYRVVRRTRLQRARFAPEGASRCPARGPSPHRSDQAGQALQGSVTRGMSGRSPGAGGASAQRRVRSPVQTRHRRRMQAAAVSRGGEVQAEAGLCVRTLHPNNCAFAALVGCGRAQRQASRLCRARERKRCLAHAGRKRVRNDPISNK